MSNREDLSGAIGKLSLSEDQRESRLFELPKENDDVGVIPIKPKQTQEDELLSGSVTLDQLESLIDYDKPQPKKSAPGSLRWYQISIKIGYWLTTNISLKILAKIKAYGHTLLTDEVYKANCEEMLRHNLHDDIDEYCNYISMKLCDYPSVTGFLDEYISTHTSMAEYKLALAPYQALMHVMGQLTSFEDLRDSTLEEVRVHGRSADTYNNDDFLETIKSLRAKIESRETSSNDYLTVTEQPEEEGQMILPLQCQKNHPPKGVSDEDHCLAQRQKQSPDEICAHCHKKNHTVNSCYCLCPDLSTHADCQGPGHAWVYRRGSPLEYSISTLKDMMETDACTANSTEALYDSAIFGICNITLSEAELVFKFDDDDM